MIIICKIYIQNTEKQWIYNHPTVKFALSKYKKS